jgi:cytidylate kinase
MAVLTISKEVGSGGEEIGKLVAEKTGYEYVVLKRAEAGFQIAGKDFRDLFKEYEEHYPGLWDRHDRAYHAFVALVQTAFLNYAQKGRVVLVGRGVNFLLEDLPQVVRVRIAASLEARVDTIVKHHDVSREAAQMLVKTEDNESARMVKFIYRKKWDDPSGYDIAFNTASQSRDDIVRMIVDTLADRDQKSGEEAKKMLQMRFLAAQIKSDISSDPTLSVPTLEVKPKGNTLTVKGVVRNQKEYHAVEEAARKVAQEIHVDLALTYRGNWPRKTVKPS